ncbi:MULTISPECIES: PAS domain-containing protein [unclassified Methylobacterium]|uniref:PAS domain-containing protein n=1 Tax=unclassified Methylobacterium TaxID=2615210 RepID=UPI0011C1D2A9|nr:MULTISPECIES: PAS domain-containing protein [unclassified Methylobacterium]QEE41170.1 PAS domain-containing protein [Methylobacterium sp. WL1]TXN56478.1 PAS domain-containing protein [Methylobacterium sp. WL2]
MSWDRSITTGEQYEVELGIRSADDTHRWFLAQPQTVRDAAGAVTQWGCTDTHIDDRRPQAKEEAVHFFGGFASKRPFCFRPASDMESLELQLPVRVRA